MRQIGLHVNIIDVLVVYPSVAYYRRPKKLLSDPALSVIWKIYSALYNHLVHASQDTLHDSKMKSKYSGLSKRLGCIQFLLDLALMCDILFEISQLSLELQKQDMSLLQVDVLIRRTIRVIESLKTMNGNYYSEAVEAKEKMMFKTIVLFYLVTKR